MFELRKTKRDFPEFDLEGVELVELSYKAQCEMLDAMRDGRDLDCPVIAVRNGIPSLFDGKTVEQIAEETPFHVISALADAVTDFSGIGAGEESEAKK